MLTALLLIAGSSSGQEQLWQKFADDLDVAEVKVDPSLLYTPLVLIRSSLQRYAPTVIRAAEHGRQRATAEFLCRSSQAVACVNANFFDQDGEPLGVVIARGQLRQKIHRGGQTLTGVFYTTRGEMKIVNRSDFTSRTALEAVQAGPRLIADGKPVEGLKDLNRTRRAGVCIDQAKRIILYVTGAGFRGLTIDEVRSILLRPDIGCVDVLNLDGGGSAQLYVDKSAPGAISGASDLVISGRDEVPVALGLVVQ